MALPHSRPDVLPEISLPQRVTGVGALLRREESIPIAAFTLERPAYQTDHAWKFVAHVAEDYGTRWKTITTEPAAPLRFEGRTDVGEVLTIDHVYCKHQRGGKLEADVWQLRYLNNPPQLAEPPSRQSITVRLTPTPLAMPEVDVLTRSYTGALAPMPSDSLKGPVPVLIPTGVGEARLSLTFSWEDVDLAGARCALRVPHATLHLLVADGARSADQFALMDAIDQASEDALMVLSFLSRRFVRWTGIYCSSLWGTEGARQASEAAIERTVQGSKPIERRAPIANGHRMKPGDLAILVNRYSKLAAKEAISAAIIYGIYVEDAPTVETAFTSAFTCFESLISGMDSAGRGGKLLSDGQFKAVRQKLKEAIGQVAAEKQLDPKVVAAMTRKLPELQRAPVIDRAVKLLEQHQVKWADLWPAGTDLREALGRAFKRRNEFLHAGVSPEPLLARADSMRLRFLSERLIFSLIGGLETWFDWRSFDEVAWLATLTDTIAVERG